MLPGENSSVGLILCVRTNAAVARYALEGLSNKVLAAEYQTVLPDENLLAEELASARRELEACSLAPFSDAPAGVSGPVCGRHSTPQCGTASIHLHSSSVLLSYRL
ncbi:PDDEXK nuclease domain-containing protein [Paraburkholderia sp. BL23I1N1]|uniref:PDDEXK nuclease domain-containing protein n=1 Tax=Paraburkholderia sp. BL23I1N1 TaxID=1938802 RepID=UPI000E754110|nr:PDDEXK nuclease domain-containing protein [Paraburkholderia sp. BL23I1N1]